MGRRLLADWRDWKSPLQDTFQILPVAQIGRISNDPVRPNPKTALYGGELFASLPDILSAWDTSVPFQIELRHIQGLPSNTGSNILDYAALARYALWMGGTADNESQRARRQEHVEKLRGTFTPSLIPGRLRNLAYDTKSAELIYPPDILRFLRLLKAEYDPYNTIRSDIDLS